MSNTAFVYVPEQSQRWFRHLEKRPGRTWLKTASLALVALSGVVLGAVAVGLSKVAIVLTIVGTSLGTVLSIGASVVRQRGRSPRHAAGGASAPASDLNGRPSFAGSPLVLPDRACLAGTYQCPLCNECSRVPYACDTCEVEWLFYDNHRGTMVPFDCARLPRVDAARRLPPPGVATRVLGADAECTLMVWRAGTDPFGSAPPTIRPPHGIAASAGTGNAATARAIR